MLINTENISLDLRKLITVNGSIAPFNTFNDSYDETICEYNFTVSRPYLMQEGWLLSSNATDSLNNFYGFSSNAGTQSILTQYSIKLQNVWLNEFVWSQNINYLMDDFAKKYTLLAVENINLGANTLKVPGKEIYIFKGNYTYNESSFTSEYCRERESEYIVCSAERWYNYWYWQL